MITPVAASFRDPAGFVFKHDELYHRAVMPGHKEVYEHFMNSGLYQVLIDEKLIISHREVELATKTAIYKTLLPEQIKFITYPYEWGFEQWKAVVLNFLSINRIALRYGMILKDATPFNFTFHQGRPVFFDTLSFSFYQEGDHWIAYRQFCESMLGPLALIKYNGGEWATQFSSFINGIPLDYTSKQLAWRSYLNSTIFLHIHLHARQYKIKVDGAGARSRLSKQKLELLIDLLSKTITNWHLKLPGKTNWQDYYSEQVISQQYLQAKETIVDEWLGELPSSGVLVDLGANNGRFSKLATKYYTEVIAIEPDSGCVNDLYDSINLLKLHNLKVVQADLMQPTPGVGWNNIERESLLQRMKGNTVLALALIHHLCIVNNLPIEWFASFVASITLEYAIVEFIPKTDPMLVKMLSLREDIFQSYTKDNFIRCFQLHFHMIKEAELNNSDRILFLWQKK